jgi:hypothetical protein
MSSRLIPPLETVLGAGAGMVWAAVAAGAALRACFLLLGFFVLVRTFSGLIV